MFLWNASVAAQLDSGLLEPRRGDSYAKGHSGHIVQKYLLTVSGSLNTF